MKKPIAALILVVASAASLTACSTASSGAVSAESPAELRLGYFPNFTHAPAIVGVEEGLYQDALGDATELKPTTFDAGPAAIEALLSGSIDAAFIGPSPTVNGYAQSNGEALQVVAGAAANGAALVVSPDITSVSDLSGTTLATPQLGNTQDVALRYWLSENGYETTTEGGGDVSIQPQSNATAVQAFAQGEIDGAWVPEPYATELVKAGGTVLVDEKTLWDNDEFVVTNLVVSKSYLQKYPGAVSDLLTGLLDSLDFIADNDAEAQTIVNDSIGQLTGSTIDGDTLETAWSNVIFTADPVAGSLIEGAEHSTALGFIDGVDLDGLYDLDALNELLSERGEDEVSGP